MDSKMKHSGTSKPTRSVGTKSSQKNKVLSDSDSEDERTSNKKLESDIDDDFVEKSSTRFKAPKIKVAAWASSSQRSKDSQSKSLRETASQNARSSTSSSQLPKGDRHQESQSRASKGSSAENERSFASSSHQSKNNLGLSSPSEAKKDMPTQKKSIKNSPLKNKEPVFDDFCPICQAPLGNLKIPLEQHINACWIDYDTLPACPKGLECCELQLFHYRDYDHRTLAAWRDSPDYVPPNLEMFTPNKRGTKRPSISPFSSSKKKKPATLGKDERSVDDPRPISTASKRKLSYSKEDLVNVQNDEPVEINLGTDIEEDDMDLYFKNLAKQSTVRLGTLDELSVDEAESLESAVNEDTSSNVINNNEDVGCDGGGDNLSDIVSDALDQYLPENTAITPVHCNVGVEYSCADNTKLATRSVQATKSSCRGVCVMKCSDELKAICNVSVKAPSLRDKTSVKNPVQINLLLDETGWQAVQVVGKKSASVVDIKIGVCDCARSMDFECLVTDPQLSNQNKQEQLEPKYSGILEELGLKKSKQKPSEERPVKSTSSHQDVDDLKKTNAQLSIKAFFKTDKDSDERNSVPVETVQKPISSKSAMHQKAAEPVKKRPQTPVIFLAGSDSSRPVTPVLLRVDENSKSAPKSTIKRSDVPGSKQEVGFSKRKKNPWINSSKVPSYKRIPDTPFVVDAFRYGDIAGVKAYFLSHFHSDHFMGLTKHFKQPLYCSKISANLIRLKMNVDPQYLHVVEIGVARIIHGVEVEAFDANHCPGSLMFLFRLLDGRCILHVGDFRACPSMERIPCMREVDHLYLDTTYLDPTYDFPSQDEIVKAVIKKAREHLAKNTKTLFVCGTYTIGKEKVFLGLAEALDCRIWAGREKTRVLHCIEDERILRRLCDDPNKAQVRVCFMKELNFEQLTSVLEKCGSTYTSLVAFRPTGWTTGKTAANQSTLKPSTRGKVTIYGVPYSEHSSFSELRRFVQFVRPKQIQVTVNATKQKHYEDKYFRQWLNSSVCQPSLDKFFNSK